MMSWKQPTDVIEYLVLTARMGLEQSKDWNLAGGGEGVGGSGVGTVASAKDFKDFKNHVLCNYGHIAVGNRVKC